jgi:hypothetical protein
MLKAKESEEFHKWLQHWSATVAQSRMVVKHTASRNEPGNDVERTADTDPGNWKPRETRREARVSAPVELYQ